MDDKSVKMVAIGASVLLAIAVIIIVIGFMANKKMMKFIDDKGLTTEFDALKDGTESNDTQAKIILR